jgi:enamine deaminase RidA (YjgF/YER057c/UK114 family)
LEAQLIVRKWSSVGTRPVFEVPIAGERSASIEAETEAAIAAGFRVLTEEGIAPEQIVRSRIWGRDAEARRRASDVRRNMLAGLKRGASASFFHPERLPENSSLMIDLIALPAGATATSKIIKEYAPPIAPPQFVTLDGMVFLSGNTDESPAFADQLRTIRHKIEEGLRNAQARQSQIVQVSAFLSASLPHSAREHIDAEFGKPGRALQITTVSGFSAPAKLVEIEVTADLN